MKLLKRLFDKKSKIPLDDRQIQLVRGSYASVSEEAEEVGALFYQNLFDLEPSLKQLFHGDMKDQQRKLMLMLDTAVKGLDDLENLLPSVRELGRRHQGYGVREEYFSLVGAALLNSLATQVGDDWDEELDEAWTSFYTLLAVTMKTELAYPAEIVRPTMT